MAKIQDIDIPYLEFAEAAAPGTPAAGIVRQYAKTDGLLYSKDDAGTETLVSGGAGGGGGIDSGTSFPVSPADNDLFHRTDLDLLAFYDGTRWLTINQYTDDIALTDAAVRTGITQTGAAQTCGRWSVPFADTYDLWIVEFQTTTFVSTTNNGTHFWTVSWSWTNAAGSFTSIDSFVTSGDTASNYVYHKEAVGAVLNNTAVSISMQVNDTDTPGVIIIAGARVVYRLVLT